MKRAARSAAQKLTDATPLSSTLFASSWGPEEPESVDLSDVRKAIREEHKLKITYRNAGDIQSERTILPIAIACHAEAIVLAGWCELRNGFRHFRPDRISSYCILPEAFRGEGDRLRQEWIKGYSEWL